MFATFILTLRWGLDAFLVVAILHAYLERTSGRNLLPAIRWGTAVSVPLSVLAAGALRAASNEALWVGLFGLCAAALTLAITGIIVRNARWTRIEGRRLPFAGFVTYQAAWLTVFLVTVVSISRAGMETANLLGTIIFQMQSFALALQGCAGTLTATIIASAWILVARRFELRQLVGATLLFLVLFVAQLSIYGFHELTEASVLPFSEPLHWATEPYGPDGRYGQYFSFLLAVVPAAYVMICAAFVRPEPVEYVKPRRPAARV